MHSFLHVRARTRSAVLLASLTASLAAPLTASTLARAADVPGPSEPPSIGDQDAAKKHFDIGKRLYKEGTFEAAVLEFEQAYKLGGRASALKNVAQCRRDLKQFAEAYAAYAQLLAVHGADFKAHERVEIETALDQLRKLTGQITLKIEPEGATVTIDGKAVGVAPFQGTVRAGIGVHKVHASKEGFEPADVDVTLVAESTVDAAVTLAPIVTTGHVSVKADAKEEVHVMVDGADVGVAPWEGDLAAGHHLVELRGSASESERRELDVTAKSRLELVLHATATTGQLKISARPKEAAIRVDGDEKGSERWVGDLPPGKHVVVVEAEGFETKSVDVTIERGETVAQDITLSAQHRELPPARTDDVPKRVLSSADPYVGVYASLSIGALFSTQSLGQCPREATPANNCNGPGTEYGGFGALRFGYNTGIVGIEFTAAAMGSYHQSSINDPVYPGYPPASASSQVTESYSYTTFGVFGGVGARVTSRDPTARVTFGTSIGAVYRSLSFDRSVSGTTVSPDNDHSASLSTICPGLIFDLALLLGSTPGTRFRIGVEAWLDFPTSDLNTFTKSAAYLVPTGSTQNPQQTFTGLTSPEFYIGPMLGLQFAE